MLVTSMFAHWGEEEFLIPSFTVFFWSCNFSCVYCQNWQISQRYEKPRKISEEELAEAIDSCGCRNVNFVGGEPTPYLPFILKTLKLVKRDIPVVWNSNFYMSEKSMHLLRNVVDVYLSDFKYGNNRCAERLSGVKNYTEIVKRNHVLAFRDSDLVVRHLVLPGHIECCSKPVLDFIAENFGKGVIVNIMPQYRPEYRAYRYRNLNRALTNEEFKAVLDYAEKLGLRFIY
ncbi:MAG TPA: radical SAM protein [Candidatus Aenigmarchaeota archaeon]|nr:radical SAM protein [Candidatus Aenigmarchaeota archaeon]